MAMRRAEDIHLDVSTNVLCIPRLPSNGWPKRRRCLDLNVKALFCFGFWPAKGCEKRGPLFYWRYFFPRIQLIRMTYSIIFQAVNVSLVWGNLSLMAEYVVVLSMYTMALLKCITIFFYQKKMQEMSWILEKLASSMQTPGTYLKTVQTKTNRLAHYVTKYIFIASAAISCLISISLIIQGFIKHTIPFRRWFPYDAYSSPAFEITLIFNFLVVPFDFTLVALCDMLFIALNVHIISQFQALAHKFRHVRDIVETSSKMMKDIALVSESTSRQIDKHLTRISKRSVSVKLEELSTWTTLPTETENRCIEISLEKEMNMKRKAVVKPRVIVLKKEVEENQRKPKAITEAENTSVEEMVENTSDIKKTNQQMERYLRHCIIHHQQIIRLCSQFGKVFKIMLSFQIFCNIGCGLVVLYVTTLARSVDAKVMTFLICACTCYLQYFFFCWYGNRITEESVNVRDAVYDCDWFGASESFKRSMRIVILRTNKPIIIRAGGLPLSMRTFKKIYKSAYYLNMLLSKLFHGEKIG